jgi:four helix bundle protein
MAFRFEGLRIWRQARAYATTVYKLTAKFPLKEDYGLTSQMNRAVNSIGLNIAEGSAKKSDKYFDYFPDTAVGSTWEVVAGGFLALDRGYITQEEMNRLYSEGESLAKSINAFRRTLGGD